MKFVVARVSGKRPECGEQIEVLEYEVKITFISAEVAQRIFQDPIQYINFKQSGKDHRIVGRTMIKTETDNVAVVELDSLDQLVNLLEIDEMVLSRHESGLPMITFYDDYMD